MHSCLTCAPARPVPLFGSDRSEDISKSASRMMTGTASLIFFCSGAGGIGLYCATKYATRCISESLHQEISPLGLRSLVFEPGYFRTDFLTAGNRVTYGGSIPDYEPIVRASQEGLNGSQPHGLFHASQLTVRSFSLQPQPAWRCEERGQCYDRCRQGSGGREGQKIHSGGPAG